MKFFKLLVLMLLPLVTACSAMHEDSDCIDSYNLVRFTFDHNMAFSCAFDSEVDRVTVMLFDRETGHLSVRVSVPHSELTDDNELLLRCEPGDYTMLVWAGEYGPSFDICEGEKGLSTAEDFHCRLKRAADADGKAVVDKDLDRLYHAKTDISLPYSSPAVPNRVTVNLKKNTNTLRVVLQQLSGNPVDADAFEVTVSDSNGWLDHDNNLRRDEQLTYRPWHTESGSVDVNNDPTDAPDNAPVPAGYEKTRGALTAMLNEFTTSRLVTSSTPTLTVRNRQTGKTVLSIPVNDYALLVKGFYHKDMDDQEYLDRQDEYNMTFFLTDDNEWASSVIIINDWRIVRHQGSLE